MEPVGTQRVEDRDGSGARTYLHSALRRRGAFADGEKEGLRKGRVDLLRTLMLKKFRTVPKWADAKLEAASERDLKVWGTPILSCASLRELMR